MPLKAKPDYSRASFVEVQAPRDQKCSCQCGSNIRRGSLCFARPYVEKGRVTGHSRIMNMDHFDDWLENVAHAYAKKIVSRRPEIANYFEGVETDYR